MRLHLLVPALFAWSSMAAASPPASSADAKAAIAESTNAILQGDSHRALAALEAVDDDQYIGFDAQYLACMRTRFQRATPPWLAGGIDDPFVRDVLWHYQDYWWHALAEPAQRAKFETMLLTRLQALLGDAAAPAADLDAIEPRLSAALEARGWHVQLGVTSPLREMMLWRKTQMRSYEVELPEGRHKVPVALLDDFAALGWSAYGRCDRGSNGGWATGQQLFAIVPAYRDGLDGEAFRVVFLGHEAQHFADKNRFPGLADWEFEYRAKLTELVQAQTVSEKRLRGFVTSQGDDIASPHTYANKRLVADLRKRLRREPLEVPIPKLQAAARELLLEDTRRRASSSPATAKP
jgi:hypothetical protein